MKGRIGVRPGLAGKLLTAFAALLCGGFLPSTEATAATGRLVVSTFTQGNRFPVLELVDPSSGGAQLFAGSPSGPSSLVTPTWNKDASVIAYYNAGTSYGVWVKPVAGGTEHQLLPNTDTRPSWSPTSDEIAYWHQTQTPTGQLFESLRVTAADGSVTRTIAGPYDALANQLTLDPPAWSPDGKSIAFVYRGNIVSVPATGGPFTPLVAGGPAGAYDVFEPSYAPDGARLAYLKGFDNGFGQINRMQLIVRGVGGGPETVITDQSETPLSHGPQSWSPDSTKIAYATSHCEGVPAVCDSTLHLANSNGGGDTPILHRRSMGAPAWSLASGPNYYIKHIEVAQTISPDLGPLNGFDDPLAEGAREIPWNLPSVAGSTIPLVADKSTLVRVYVGDSKLEPGTTEERFVHYKITGSTLSQALNPAQKVTVTAPDVDPTQTDADAALNVWLPPQAARSGSPVSVAVEINTKPVGGQAETECDGCYPNGNKASLNGMQFEDGGNVIIAPVPIYVIAPDLTVTGPREGWEQLWPLLDPMLPVRDSGVSSVASPAILAVNFNDLLPGKFASLDPFLDKWYACKVLVTRVEEERLISAPATLAPGALRWVGLTSHPLPMSQCGGRAFLPGRSMLLTEPRPEFAVHEFGHSLGLPHTLGYGEKVPDGAVVLPYIGIGGAGYESIGGYLVEVFNKLNYGDIMSYSPKTWTSPFAWHGMFGTILAESSGLASPAAANRFARARAPARRSRRLVSGFVAGGHGVILRSLVANAAEPTSRGTVIGSIVGRDREGRMIATAKVRGNAAHTASPFVVGLPASKRIASLALVRPARGKPLSRLKASRHSPKARFIRLPRRASAGKPLKVRWRASDRDRNRITVTLLAKRGKQAWDTIAMGPAAFHARVKPWTLGKGKKLRLRLLASDGFNTTTVKARPVRLRCARSRITGGVAVPSITAPSGVTLLANRSSC